MKFFDFEDKAFEWKREPDGSFWARTRDGWINLSEIGAKRRTYTSPPNPALTTPQNSAKRRTSAEISADD